MMARKCIEKYLETHKSTYIGRYRCHSAVQTKKFEHKFHYYILDIQFKAIDVFVTIDYSGDEIVPTFSVNLHEQEQEYIIKDALNKILYFNQFKTILHCHVFEHFIETHTVNTILEPLDYRNILDYLEYHSGTNQETVDEFYTFFNPYLDRLLYNKNLSCNIFIIFLSSSTQITFLASCNKNLVSVPSPGPISITKSSLLILADFTIVSTTSPFIKKFCPRLLLAFILYFFIINFVSSKIFSIFLPLAYYNSFLPYFQYN